MLRAYRFSTRSRTRSTSPGAGTLHLHVRVDGEVRRGLRRAQRPPCRRGRAHQQSAAAHPQACDLVWSVLRRVVHRRRRHDGREVRLWPDGHRSIDARSRAAELDRLSLHPARLVSYVLPLPAGRVGLFLDRRTAASRSRPRRRRGRESASGARSCCAGARTLSAAIIFGLLIALMLTGMPISIALGLTVLTFLFTMTEVPIEAVGLKLFTGIENFEIMAVLFFILSGNFLTHGGVAKRMIAFATAMIGHWPGGLGL